MQMKITYRAPKGICLNINHINVIFKQIKKENDVVCRHRT